ncbi:uncharacterized protein LOC124189031 isoform X1 [Daphnia pulex]|uniref:uncharacterized protein LOC124189031 isoform X1 n=1 Tax=Daphnia pulex TaxID=6669 RepID=UPI001EDDBC0C|nr:uncharacterized protein LOC124189031 isoform X1 [Daphnia pulex]
MHAFLLFISFAFVCDIVLAVPTTSGTITEKQLRQFQSYPFFKPSASVLLPRQNVFGLSNINSAFKLFSPLISAAPRPNSENPDMLIRTFSSCESRGGHLGNCVPSAVCNAYGGRPSGSCGALAVCCVLFVSKCGEKITLNNTYWRNAPAVSSDTTCSLTVVLDNNLVEQRRRSCQVRLDFKSFSIAQPNAATGQCDSDYFQVGGAVNKVPVICGDNEDQHMYLEAPSSTTEFMMLLKFGVSTVIRKWDIRISLIPCGSDVLAPRDCLQYFTKLTGIGTVKSFNWKDAAGMRQLAEMDYKICFRNELINKQVYCRLDEKSQKAIRICYTQCDTQTDGRSFHLSGLADTYFSSNGAINCPSDFLLIPNGFNPQIPTDVSDRYCGGALNPAVAEGPPVTVCSTTKDFNIIYHTNDVEGVAAVEERNSGFCLNYEQRIA